MHIIIETGLIATNLFTQSSEVQSSYHMKKEGLDRALKFLKENGIRVGVLVTDRHKQIGKWLRETHGEVKYYFDVWHIAKGELHHLKITLSYNTSFVRTTQKT